MTESTTSKMDNLQQKHEEIGTCSCKDCHHSRMERIQKERKQLQVNRYILQNTNYGHIHYVHHVTMERTYELSIQPVTAIKVKTNVHELQPTTIDVNEVKLANTTTPWDSQEMHYDESTVEMGIVKPKSVGMTIQEIKPSRNMKLSELQIYDPEDVDIFYDASSHLDDQGQVSKDYEDKNVLPMDSDYYLGVKKKTQQRIGRQVSFNLLTSQVLGYNEPCQWKQRNSTHMGPVHCVNRKRKKKRTSQGLSRIELQHGKRKNLQPLLNLSRLLVHYII